MIYELKTTHVVTVYNITFKVVGLKQKKILRTLHGDKELLMYQLDEIFIENTEVYQILNPEVIDEIRNIVKGYIKDEDCNTRK